MIETGFALRLFGWNGDEVPQNRKGHVKMNSKAKKVDQSQIVEIPSKELASIASAMQLQSGLRVRFNICRR